MITMMLRRSILKNSFQLNMVSPFWSDFDLDAVGRRISPPARGYAAWVF